MDGVTGFGGDLVRGHRAGTLVEFGILKLRRLASQLGLAQPMPVLEEHLRDLLTPWGNRAVGTAPHWPSDITDDGTPFEFSLAFLSSGPPGLRVLVEAQSPHEEHSLERQWAAGVRLTERLVNGTTVDCQRFHQVADLFEPTPSSKSTFAIWHAVRLGDPHGLEEAPKIYLNPQIHGPAEAERIMEEALRRLGLAHAWEDLSNRLNPRRQHRLVYFSLDLSSGAKARAKIYVAQEGATTTEIDSMFRGTRDYQPGDVTNWCTSVLEGRGPFRERPVLSCFAYNSVEEAPVATLHLPVRSYVLNDEVSAWRVSNNLLPNIAGAYRKAIAGFANRDLRDGRSLQTYVSFRRQHEETRLTVYLAPEAYYVTPAMVPREHKTPTARKILIGTSAPTTMSSLVPVITAESEKLAATPFVRRLAGPGSLEDCRVFARGLTFFVMAFQDMLRACADLVTDPVLKKVATRHRLEDMGHDAWFLHDLELLGRVPDLQWAFGPEQEVVRDISYSIMSEIYRAKDDRVIIAILLSLEGSGMVFFSRVTRYLARMGTTDNFRFFGPSHLEVEESHNFEETGASSMMDELGLPFHVRSEAVSAIRRVFAGITRLAASLEEQVELNQTLLPMAMQRAVRSA